MQSAIDAEAPGCNLGIMHKGKFLHKGMTSSDILDTCFNIQLIQAGKILDKDIDEILKVLKNIFHSNKIL